MSSCYSTYPSIYYGINYYNRPYNPCYTSPLNPPGCVNPCPPVNVPPPNPLCPNITVITSAITPFNIPSAPAGTAAVPVPIGATSIPNNSTITPINTQNLFNPEVNFGGISYTPVNGQFTVPVAGRYLVSATFSFASLETGGIRDVYIYKVDAVTRVISLLAGDSRNAVAVGTTRVTITTVANLNVTDSIFFAAAQNSGSGLNIFPIGDPTNRFIITRLC